MQPKNSKPTGAGHTKKFWSFQCFTVILVSRAPRNLPTSSSTRRPIDSLNRLCPQQIRSASTKCAATRRLEVAFLQQPQGGICQRLDSKVLVNRVMSIGESRISHEETSADLVVISKYILPSGYLLVREFPEGEPCEHGHAFVQVHCPAELPSLVVAMSVSVSSA